MSSADRPPDGGTRGVDYPDDDELRNRMRFRDELNYSFDNHVQWLVESEQHLLKVFRFYILVLGAFISFLSLLINQTDVQFPGIFNVYTTASIVYWTIAAWSAVVALAVIWAPLGPDDLHHTTEEESRKGEFKEADKEEMFSKLGLDDDLAQDSVDFEDEVVLPAYIRNLHHNEEELGKVRYPFLYGGMALVVVSVLLFGLGVLHTLADGPDPVRSIPNGGPPIPAIYWVGLVVVVIGAGLSLFLVLQVIGVREKVWKEVTETPKAVDGFRAVTSWLYASPYLLTEWLRSLPARLVEGARSTITRARPGNTRSSPAEDDETTD